MSYTTYKGASDIMNMAWVVLERKCMEEVQSITKKKATVQERTIEKRSLRPPPEFRTNDRVVVEWRGINLTAVVLDSTPIMSCLRL